MGHCLCMSNERSDSMGITESPFSTADSRNIPHISKKGKGKFAVFDEK